MDPNLRRWWRLQVSRGFGMALYSGFGAEVYPDVFRIEVIVLSKVMCFEEFLGLKMACLLSERQVKSVRH